MSGRKEIVTALADILKNLPSEFREDYPKSVPLYVIRDIEAFNNRYKENIHKIRDTFKAQATKLAKTERALEVARDGFKELRSHFIPDRTFEAIDETQKQIKEILEG